MLLHEHALENSSAQNQGIYILTLMFQETPVNLYFNIIMHAYKSYVEHLICVFKRILLTLSLTYLKRQQLFLQR